MKILHTSDWHLGKTLKELSRIEEQKIVLEEIVQIAEKQKVDVVLIAGDIFDTKSPSTEATALLYKTLKRLSRNGKVPILGIAGNHDSPKLIETPEPLAKECGIFLFGYPFSQLPRIKLPSKVEIKTSDKGFVEVVLPDYDYNLRLIATPYADEARIKKELKDEGELRDLLKEKWEALANKYCDDKGVNVLMTHFYFTKKIDIDYKEPTDIGEKLILTVGGSQAIPTSSIPKQIQYVALGHLHAMDYVSKSPCPIVYSSSPVAYSFSEEKQTKYVVIIDAKPNEEVVCENIALVTPRTLQKEFFTSYQEAIAFVEKYPNDYLDITIDATHDPEMYSTIKVLRENPNILELKIASSQDTDEQEMTPLDLNKSSEELFKDFYEYKKGKGVKPSEGLLNVFRELLGDL